MKGWWYVADDDADDDGNDDDDDDDDGDGDGDDEESNGMALWQFWLYLWIYKPITLCCHNDQKGNLR